MNISNVFDDIDYDNDDTVLSNEDSVSQFCIALFDGANCKPIGSGVIINSQGLFISVAHNFNNEKCEPKAFFDGQVYDIFPVYKEYEQGKLDLFIGQLICLNSDKYSNRSFPILVSPAQLEVGNTLCVAGFKELKLNETENLGAINPIEDLHITKQRFNTQIPIPDTIQKNLISELGDKFTFFMKSEGAEKYTGFSGGPVYVDDKIYGIVVSHYFLNADYIRSMLSQCELKL